MGLLQAEDRGVADVNVKWALLQAAAGGVADVNVKWACYRQQLELWPTLM